MNRKMNKGYCFDMVGRGAQTEMGEEPLGVGLGLGVCGLVWC